MSYSIEVNLSAEARTLAEAQAIMGQALARIPAGYAVSYMSIGRRGDSQPIAPLMLTPEPAAELPVVERVAEVEEQTTGAEEQTTEAAAETTGAKVPSVEDVRAAGMAAVNAGKRSAVEALLREFGAAQMSKLSEEHRAEFIERCAAL